MKRVIIFIYLAIFTGTVSYSQKLFMYKENGEKVYFQEIDSLVYVKYRKGMSGEERLKFAKTVNVNYDVKNNQTDREIILIDKQNKPDFAKLKKSPTVIYANKSLIDSEGTLQVLTNKVMVKTKTQYKLEDILEKLHMEYESYKQLGHNEHSFVIVLKTGESLEIANKLYESGYFEYAQLSFARFQGLMNEYYQNQWGLNNTGQYGGTTGIDIKAAQAWGIATGSNVKVAVVDQGVDLTHPDLQANLLSGYDATDGSLGGIYGACLDYDVHGTACAGIIAAADNTIGTKGVAPNCKIVPVRVSYGAYHYYYGYSEI